MVVFGWKIKIDCIKKYVFLSSVIEVFILIYDDKVLYEIIVCIVKV